jgi:hypothetical protein
VLPPPFLCPCGHCKTAARLWKWNIRECLHDLIVATGQRVRHF